MTMLSRAYPTRTVSEIVSIKEWSDLETRGRGCSRSAHLGFSVRLGFFYKKCAI